MCHAPALSLLLAAAVPLAAQGAGREGADHAERREEAQLAWSGGRPTAEYLDFKARLAAREAAAWRPLFARGAEAAAVPAWRNLGPRHQTVLRIAPDNDGGRITSLAVHPTDPRILYVATQSGIFRCANADPASSGDWNWESLGDALPSSSAAGNLSIGAIALSPADPATLYAGMGDPHGTDSRGFYVSRDAGATWSAGLNLGTATRTLDLLALHAGVILVGTNAGLWRSTDGGASFTNLSLGGSTSGAAWSIRAVTGSDLVCTRNGQIFWSADQGATWTAAALDASVAGLGASRISVEVSPASSTRVWGVSATPGNLARGLRGATTRAAAGPLRGGPHGSRQPLPGQRLGQRPHLEKQPRHALRRRPGHPQPGPRRGPRGSPEVFVGANLALYRTQNGGASWSGSPHWGGFTRVYSHADPCVTAWAKAGPKTLYLSSDGGRHPPPARPLAHPQRPWDVGCDPAFLDHRRNKGLATQLIYHLGSTPAATPPDARWRHPQACRTTASSCGRTRARSLAASSFFPRGGAGQQGQPRRGRLRHRDHIPWTAT